MIPSRLVSVFYGSIAVAVLVAFFLFASPTAARRLGDEVPTLDLTFPGGGVVDVPNGGANYMVPSADGSVLLSTLDAPIYQYRADGTPDSNFGDNGRVVVHHGYFDVFPQGMARASDGYIWVGGRYASKATSNLPCVVARLLPDGTMDPDFGEKGATELPFDCGSPYQVLGVVVQPDGKGVVLIRYTYEESYFLYRLQTDSTPDPTFGDNGMVTLPDDYATTLLLQEEGLVVAGYSATQEEGETLKVRRYTFAQGAIDPTFGDAGTSTIAIEGYISFRGATIAPDGDIYVGAQAYFTGVPTARAVVAHLSEDGVRDTEYGTDGFFTISHPTMPEFVPQYIHLVVDAAERLLVTAAIEPDPKRVLAMRVLPTGDIDSTFAEEGLFYNHPMGLFGSTLSLITEDGGYLIAAGRFLTALVKLTADGEPDQTFGQKGYFAIGNARPLSGVTGVVYQPDGSVYAAGHDGETTNGRTFVVRFRADGIIDETYGNQGIAYISEVSDTAIDMAVTETGEVILVGFRGPDIFQSTAWVARLTTMGQPDAAFGDKGILLFGDPNVSIAHSLEIDLDGSYLVAGRRFVPNASDTLTLHRFLPNGTPDTTFGANGVTEVEACTGAGYVGGERRQTKTTIAPTGEIYVAALCYENEVYGFRTFRFLADGARDMTWGTQGQTLYSGFATLGDVLLQSDGKVLLGGAFFHDFGVLRYSATGQLDNTYGQNGIARLTPVNTDETSETYLSAFYRQTDDGLILYGHVAEFGSLLARRFFGRLLPNGTPDLTFGDNGSADISLGAQDYSSGFVVVNNLAYTAGFTYFTGGDYGAGLTVARYDIGTPLAPTPTATATVVMTSTPTVLPTTTPSVTPTTTPTTRTLYLPLVRR